MMAARHCADCTKGSPPVTMPGSQGRKGKDDRRSMQKLGVIQGGGEGEIYVRKRIDGRGRPGDG